MKKKAAETRNAGAITALRAEYEALRAENAARKEQIAELSQKVEWLMEQWSLLPWPRMCGTGSPAV